MKSNFAFDTIFAEWQRHYIESLSSYVRKFLRQLDKPNYESIKGFSPTIYIEQKLVRKNQRLTVGTVTGIYDYLRVLFASVSAQYCYYCGKKVGCGNAVSMVKQILSMPVFTKIIILAPVIENRKGEHKEIFDNLRKKGFARIRIDGVEQNLSYIQSLSKHKKHNIEVVIDCLDIIKTKIFLKKFTDFVEIRFKVERF